MIILAFACEIDVIIMSTQLNVFLKRCLYMYEVDTRMQASNLQALLAQASHVRCGIRCICAHMPALQSHDHIKLLNRP